jgi:hypothetical protein
MSAITARQRWARALMKRAGGRVPPYGSAEWLALPEGDSRKVAAVVRAAECWATDGDNLEERLRVEVEALQAAHKAAEDADYEARRDTHREMWAKLPDDLERARYRAEQRYLWLAGGEAS